MPSATITTAVSGNVDSSYSKSFTVTGGARLAIEEAVADGSSDLEVACELDVSQVKSFLLLCDQDVTVETNDGTTPGNTFTLEANTPYIWPAAEGESWADTEDAAVTDDITALFVTNASGTDATLRLDAIFDPTV